MKSAAKQGNLRVMEFLDEFANPHLNNYDCPVMLPLEERLDKSHLDCAEFFYNKKKSRGFIGNLLINNAVAHQDPDILRYIINTSEMYSESDLDCALKIILESNVPEYTEKIQILLSNGADVNRIHFSSSLDNMDEEEEFFFENAFYNNLVQKLNFLQELGVDIVSFVNKTSLVAEAAVYACDKLTHSEMMKCMKPIRYLLSLPGVDAEKKSLYGLEPGVTALEHLISIGHCALDIIKSIMKVI